MKQIVGKNQRYEFKFTDQWVDCFPSGDFVLYVAPLWFKKLFFTTKDSKDFTKVHKGFGDSI